MLSGKVLSDDQTAQIQSAAEEILERAGCRVMDARALELCHQAGALVDEASGRVRFPRQLLGELISQAPGSYQVKGLDGIARPVGDGRQWGLGIVTDPWIIDYQTGQPRRPCSEDIRRNTAIGQSLERILEVLFLLALTQLHRPGHPFLYAFGPAVGNMQNGACLYYTLDKVLWKLASVQLGKSCGLPVCAECGGAMVHRADQQSGAEGMLFMAAAVNSGADALAGFGSTGSREGRCFDRRISLAGSGRYPGTTAAVLSRSS